MTREGFIGKLLHLMVMAIRDGWDLEYFIENIERSIETYHMVTNK